MLISYYANKKSSPRLPWWQPSLISFNTPIDSGSIIKPCTLKHFQVPILAPGLQGELALVITPVCTSIHYPLMCDYTLNCVWNVIMFSVLSILQGCIFILPFHCTTLILSCCEIFLMPSVLCVFIFVNSVIFSSIISCYNLCQDSLQCMFGILSVEIQYLCKVRYGLHWAHAT